MEIKQVDQTTAHIYDNLCQAYEAEFSPLTQKQPDENGLFAKDTALEGAVIGFLVYQDGRPAGLAAIKQEPAHQFEVCEFYVVPYYRRHKLGQRFAHALFDQMQGDWQIKQIEGATHATAFWRSALKTYAGPNFQEDIYHDPYWGQVTRQSFKSQAPAHALRNG